MKIAAIICIVIILFFVWACREVGKELEREFPTKPPRGPK